MPALGALLLENVAMHFDEALSGLVELVFVNDLPVGKRCEKGRRDVVDVLGDEEGRTGRVFKVWKDLSPPRRVCMQGR